MANIVDWSYPISISAHYEILPSRQHRETHKKKRPQFLRRSTN